MVERVTLLPGNASPLALTLSDVDDDFANLIDPFNSILGANNLPPAAFLPFLIWEYGLGELSPYLPNLNDLISQGIHWQRIRGTPASIYLGLSWLGYGGVVENVPTRRTRWNQFWLELSRVRDNDLPDLARIAGIVQLSPPERSIFARGFRTYDVRACETGYQKTGMSLTADSSGVYIPNVPPKWSFGRRYERDTTFTEAELTALGVWIPEIAPGGLWVDDHTLWVDETFLWATPAVGARLKAIAEDVEAIPAYVRFTNAANAVIGYARAAVLSAVESGGGEFTFGVQQWTSFTDAPTANIVEAMSGFGDGNGQTAAHAAVLFAATRAMGVPPGKDWLAPSELSGGVVVAQYDVNIPFGLTVRERVRFLLRI